ncbi:MAG: SPASM domain-containing protein, partial [Candidatus Bathyarchaeia archaeon]
RAAENMVSSGLDELFISLDGATPETYERIRVGAHLDHVIENTKNLLRTKEKAGSSTPEVLIIMTAMRENFTEIPRMVELAHSIGVKSVAVQGLQVFGEGMARRDQLVSEMKPRDVLRIIHQSKRLGKSLGVNIEFARMVPKPQQCFWPWVACFITYDGQVAPCCMINQRIDREEVLESLGFGNVLKEPFKEIWNSEKAMLFRLKLATGDLPLICRGCPVLDGTVISF